MDQDKNRDYEEENYITLEFDDGEAVECEILGVFDVEGQEYMALAADDGSEEIYFFHYREIDEEEFEILDIEEEEEFQKVADIFNEIMEEEEDEDDGFELKH